MRAGAAGVLVGFGGGAAHTTRKVLGIEVPMASAVAEVASARRDYLDESGGRYVHVIADGSVSTSGEIAKAIACPAVIPPPPPVAFIVTSSVPLFKVTLVPAFNLLNTKSTPTLFFHIKPVPVPLALLEAVFASPPPPVGKALTDIYKQRSCALLLLAYAY